MTGLLLEDRILDYIKNNHGVDSVDICTHFYHQGSAIDVILESIAQLVDDNKIVRVWRGFEFTYGYAKL